MRSLCRRSTQKATAAGRIRGMETKYQYVVLCSDGTSYAVDHQAPFSVWGQQRPPRFDLGKLLASGWIPVRESAMGGGEHYAYSLILLQHPA